MSINVPNEKALAVADAMEQDMLDKLATKAELQAFRNDVAAEFKLVRQEQGASHESLAKDVRNLESALTVKLWTIGVVLTGTLFGLLKLTS